MAHQPVTNHQRNGRPLVLRECQELRCKVTTDIAVERNKVCDPESVEDRKKQQRVFGRLSERLSLFDQQTRPLHSRLSFGGGIPFDMDEWSYKRNLKFNLLATQRGSSGQGRNLVERTLELLYGFSKRRTVKRPLSRLTPQASQPSRSSPLRYNGAPAIRVGSPLFPANWLSITPAIWA